MPIALYVHAGWLSRNVVIGSAMNHMVSTTSDNNISVLKGDQSLSYEDLCHSNNAWVYLLWSEYSETM